MTTQNDGDVERNRLSDSESIQLFTCRFITGTFYFILVDVPKIWRLYLPAVITIIWISVQISDEFSDPCCVFCTDLLI